MTIPKILANNPHIKLGISEVRTNSHNIQTAIPAIIDINAPVREARFQYKPAVNGTNKDTKLNAEDWATKS